jgi:hypothetical protein
LKPTVKDTALRAKIFHASPENFPELALAVFRFQHENNVVYNQYCHTIKVDPEAVLSIDNIPFLPISFFKTHTVTSTLFNPAAIFESSGTTQTINSRHLVKDLSVYEESFTRGFERFYGPPPGWCIIALLPSYLERKNSSLVMMADQLITKSLHPQSGFYLHEYEKLHSVLTELENQQQKTLLLGVTFALLDLAEKFPSRLVSTLVMETGGMKGRREELTRQQVHELLCTAFQQEVVHSEYGMTELLSQAYSTGKGIFNCPPWMKILIREEDDPFAVHIAGEKPVLSGAVNIIDLANLYSCSFIATDDAGKLYPDESFEIMGRLDHSDIRGCSLMAL